MPDITTPHGRLAYSIEADLRKLLYEYEAETLKFPKAISISLGPIGIIHGGLKMPRIEVTVEP